MRTLLGLAMVVGLAAAGGAGADDKDKIDAKKLIGKWEPKEEKKGSKMVIEYTKDGKVVLTADAEGKEFKVEGTYKLTGNKLELALKIGEMEVKDTVTITKLTDDEMEGESGKGGKKESFKKLKAK